MGVYIDMEMPDGCYYCPFRQGSFGYVPPHRAMCMVTGEVMPVDGENIQHDQPCPLVPVPPHGRLIDQDAILKEVIRGDYPNQWIDKKVL